MNKPVHDGNNRSARSRPIGGDSRFRMIFDAVKEGIFISDPATGRFIEINEPGCRMFGYERTELIGSNIVLLSSGVHPYTQDGAIEKLQKASLEGPQTFEWHAKTKSGVLFWVEISLRYVEFGKIPATVAIVRDIDERKRSVDKLREAEAALVEAQALAHVGSFQVDWLDNHVTWTDECFRILGYNSSTVTPSFDAYLARIHPDDLDAFRTAHRQSIGQRNAFTRNQRIVRGDGTIRFVQQRWQHYYGVDGKPLHTTGTIQDITERTITESALTRERDLSAALIDSLPGLFVVLDESGSIIRSNNNFSAMTGIANEELQGANAFELVVESDRELLRSKLQEALTRGIANVEIGVNTKAGDVRTIHWSGRSVTTEGHPNLVAVGIDVTEQRTTERHLRESEEKFHTVFDTINDGVIVHDATTGLFIDVNQRLCDMFGYSRDEMLKLDVGALGAGSGAYTRERAESNFKTALANKSAGFEWQCKRKDGSQFWTDVFIRCADIGDKPFVLSTAHDITERKHMLDDLGYRDKLLHAVTTATSELIAGKSLEAGAQKAIAIIGEALRVDRITVLEHADEGRGPPLTRYYWQAPDSGLPRYGALPSVWGSATPEALKAWLAPMVQGKPVIAHARTAAAPIRELLLSLQNKSVLMMPILSGGRPWGVIGIDMCKSEREWAKADIEALAIFAEIIGIVIFRNGTQASLKKSEERFQAVSHTAQDAIIIIDSAAKVSYWNPAAERILRLLRK